MRLFKGDTPEMGPDSEIGQILSHEQVLMLCEDYSGSSLLRDERPANQL